MLLIMWGLTMTNQTRRKSSKFEWWRDFHIVYFPEFDKNLSGRISIEYSFEDLEKSAHIANQAILNMMRESK